MICSQRPASCFLYPLLRSPFHVCLHRLLALSNRFRVSLAATASLPHCERGRGFRMFVLFSSIICYLRSYFWDRFPQSISRPTCMPLSGDVILPLPWESKKCQNFIFSAPFQPVVNLSLFFLQNGSTVWHFGAAVECSRTVISMAMPYTADPVNGFE